MNNIDLPSPNHDSRNGQPIDMLVLHYTGMKTGAEARARLVHPEAKVSAHYVVEENGDIYRLVAEENRAWHAGVSQWRGNTNINQRSIGIEIVNPGHEFGYRAFPDAQMESVALLCKDILSRHDIPKRNIVAHSDIAPVRKEDPGELFDWKGLANQGIGLWPEEKQMAQGFSGILWGLFNILSLFNRQCASRWSLLIAHRGNASLYRAATGKLPDEAQLADALNAFGYDIADLPKAITAFQRHFCPARLTGIWDRECALRLTMLKATL